MVNVQVFGERRLHKRKTCAFPVTIDDQKTAYPAIIRNLSLGGALIETPNDRKPKIGQELIITIPFQLKKDSVAVKGKIGRIKDGNIGITFVKGGI